MPKPHEDGTKHRKPSEESTKPKGKGSRQQAWRERNPLAIWAHAATRSAIRRGLIVPQPCEVCGAKAEAHHPDHADPLRVQWLCRIHHKRLHAALRRGQG